MVPCITLFIATLKCNEECSKNSAFARFRNLARENYFKFSCAHPYLYTLFVKKMLFNSVMFKSLLYKTNDNIQQTQRSSLSLSVTDSELYNAYSHIYNLISKYFHILSCIHAPTNAICTHVQMLHAHTHAHKIFKRILFKDIFRKIFLMKNLKSQSYSAIEKIRIITLLKI